MAQILIDTTTTEFGAALQVIEWDTVSGVEHVHQVDISSQFTLRENSIVLPQLCAYVPTVCDQLFVCVLYFIGLFGCV